MDFNFDKDIIAHYREQENILTATGFDYGCEIAAKEISKKEIPIILLKKLDIAYNEYEHNRSIMFIKKWYNVQDLDIYNAKKNIETNYKNINYESFCDGYFKSLVEFYKEHIK